jgi:Ca2+/Na+ antiporter
MNKKDLTILCVSTIIVALFLVILLLENYINTSQAIEIILTYVLVCVTIVYVRRTAEIANATKQQAEASLEMAKEMREQLLNETRPYLLLRLTDEYLKWEDKSSLEALEVFSITIFNSGKGPAINLEASLWKYNDIFPVNTKGYLALNQEWEANISRTSTDGIALGEVIPWSELMEVIDTRKISVIVKYEDIHHRQWISYLYLERMDDTGSVRDGEQSIIEVRK